MTAVNVRPIDINNPDALREVYQARIIELENALRELLEAESAFIPPYEAGADAQEAWAIRKARARVIAREVLK